MKVLARGSNGKNSHHKKFYLTLLVVIVLAALALGILIWKLAEMEDQNYYAVYMNSGDLYFGKLRMFPWLSLTDVWMLNRTSDGQYGLAKFSQVFWGPGNRMWLNKDHILWMTPLRSTGQAATAIRMATDSNSTIYPPDFPFYGNNSAPQPQGTSTATSTRK